MVTTSLLKVNKKTQKRLVALIFIILMSHASLIAEDWILSAMQFSFTQPLIETNTSKDLSSILPQLILEKIVTGTERKTTTREMLNRKLDDLLTKRLSLFLQLSKEIKTRDTIIFVENNQRQIHKKQEEAEEKIKEIEKQIDENLRLTEKAKEETQKAISEEENNIYNLEEREKFSLKKIFSTEEDKIVDHPKPETITIYKKDSNLLYSPSQTISASGITSREFTKAVTSEKIKGLITGSITVYGEYMAVTAELFIFPGAQSVGVITEVGTVNDLVTITDNIARFMIPKIFNSLPIRLMFDINPPEVLSKAKVAVDGFVYSTVPQEIVTQAGIHSIEISCEGWESQTVTWNFCDNEIFVVSTTLSKSTEGLLTLSLMTPVIGNVFADGDKIGSVGKNKIDTEVKINGNPVIGQILTNQRIIRTVEKEVTDKDGNKIKTLEEQEGSYLGSFFYIPEKLAKENYELMVSAKPLDNEKQIDKRRIWMYRGYTAVILTLPISFGAYGKFNAMLSQYNKGYSTNINELNKLQRTSQIAIGVSCVAGAFFVYELVRYLLAADNVIPAQAVVAKETVLDKSLLKSQTLNDQDNNKENTEDLNEKELINE